MLRWDFALIALAVTPVFAIFVLRVNKAIKTVVKEVRTLQSDLVSTLQEGPQSTQVIQAFGHDDRRRADRVPLVLGQVFQPVRDLAQMTNTIAQVSVGSERSRVSAITRTARSVDKVVTCDEGAGANHGPFPDIARGSGAWRWEAGGHTAYPGRLGADIGA